MNTEPNPLERLINFFQRLPDAAVQGVVIGLVFQIDGNPGGNIKTARDARNWVRGWLDDAARRDANILFGRLVWLVALLDFELSDHALRMRRARALKMLHDHPDDAEFYRNGVRWVTDSFEPTVSAWRDARTHELDNAALQVFRDHLGLP